MHSIPPRPIAAALLCLALTLAAPSSSGASQTNPAPAFSPGETLVYGVRYLGISVGKVMAVVGATTEVDGRKAWPIMGVARTDPFYSFWPVKDRFVTWWDPETQTSLGSEYHVDHDHWRRKERIRYDRQAGTAHFVCEKEYAPRFEETVKVEPDTRDIIAALYTLRGRRLAVGDHEEISVYTGKRVFPMKVDVQRAESLEVGAGRFDAVIAKVEVSFSGKAAAKTMTVAFSNDPRHLPLRMDAEFLFGAVVAELKSYEKGVSHP